jgi:hypothetical protein
MVIVACRAKPGQEAALLALMKIHLPMLRQLGLATDRPALMMRDQAGTIVEVFEWRAGGVAAAHEHPQVQELWQKYAEVCDYLPLRDLPEAANLFATFEPIDL